MSHAPKLYKVVSCNNETVTVQSTFKAAVLNLTWDEVLMPEYIKEIDKQQIFFIGTYYAHNKRDMKNLAAKLSHDSEVAEVEKLILSEIRGGNYLLMDVKTRKLETLSIKFIISNLHLLNSFTAIQSFFLGIRAGTLYDKNNLSIQ